MMKSYKHVNKKPKLIPKIYYAVKPLKRHLYTSTIPRNTQANSMHLHGSKKMKK